jgi:phage terminase large subunit
MAVQADFPSKLRYLFSPARYKVAHGGRGGAKSWNFARALIIIASSKRLRVLCAREFQNSITESVHKLLSDQIELLKLSSFFRITNTNIVGLNGSEFIFAGIKNNVTKIKSTEGVDVCWVEEAEKVSSESWEILIPTIRKPGSEIWISFNPNLESDPTYKRFILNPPDDAVVVKMSWRDNPWFPEELRREKDYLARVDHDAYMHVWEGECRISSSAQVLRDKVALEAFTAEADWQGPYFGADWGFATDPTAAVKLWVHERKLYLEHEVYGVGVEIDAIPQFFDKIPGAREHVMRGDNARPETISYLQRHGYPRIYAAEKWPGSVEDGIAFLRSFEQIVIHPRCVNSQQEAKLWSYKVDRLTGDVLPQVVDANNHIWDAVRYALQPMIRNSGTGLLVYYQQEAEKLERTKKGLPA